MKNEELALLKTRGEEYFRQPQPQIYYTASVPAADAHSYSRPALPDNIANRPVSDLHLSVRVLNAFSHSGIKTIGDAASLSRSDILQMKSLGEKSFRLLEEEFRLLKKLGGDYFDPPQLCLSMLERTASVQGNHPLTLPDSITSRPVGDLHISVRIRNAFTRNSIKTIGDAANLTSLDVLRLKNVGKKSLKMLENELSLLWDQGEEYFTRSQIDESAEGKGFDFDTIDLLTEQFFLKQARMSKWFQLTRQSIHNVMVSRAPRRRDVWTEKELTEEEQSLLTSMIENGKLEYSDGKVICCCLNNRKDDFACVFVYKNEIKCFFLKDLPETLQKVVTTHNYHRYSKSELSGTANGIIVHIFGEPYFLPDDRNRFRINAAVRGMSPDEYSVFISGYPLCDARHITDEQVIAAFNENMVNGKVYVSSAEKDHWLRSLAARNGYSLQEFIEFFGYTKLSRLESESSRAKKHHIKAVKEHIIYGNVVYLPATSYAYKLLLSYSHNRNISMDDYIASLGFIRIRKHPGTGKYWNPKNKGELSAAEAG